MHRGTDNTSLFISQGFTNLLPLTNNSIEDVMYCVSPKCLWNVVQCSSCYSGFDNFFTRLIVTMRCVKPRPGAGPAVRLTGSTHQRKWAWFTKRDTASTDSLTYCSRDSLRHVIAVAERQRQRRRGGDTERRWMNGRDFAEAVRRVHVTQETD